MQSLETLETIEFELSNVVNYSVIWLHGLGADGHDFASLIPELKLPRHSPIRFIFPHAPIRPITLNNGVPMRGWYDVPTLEFKTQEDEEGIRHSEKLVINLIEKENARGIDYGNMILAGFSQGGAMALHCGLRFPHQLAGIMALSTYLPLSYLLEKEADTANQNTPIFFAHGKEDNIVPYHLAEMSKKFLQTRAYQVEWHAYSMGHSVCLDEIQDVRAWLVKIFAEVF